MVRLIPAADLGAAAEGGRDGQVIVVMRERLLSATRWPACTRSQLAWLERQAEAAEDLVAKRQAAAKHHAD